MFHGRRRLSDGGNSFGDGPPGDSHGSGTGDGTVFGNGKGGGVPHVRLIGCGHGFSTGNGETGWAELRDQSSDLATLLIIQWNL